MAKKLQFPVLGLIIKYMQLHYMWPKTTKNIGLKYFVRLVLTQLVAVPLILGMILKKIEIFMGKHFFHCFVELIKSN